MEGNCIIIHNLYFCNIRDTFQRIERWIGLLMLKISFDCRCVKILPIMESNTFTQMESQLCLIIIIFPALRKSRHNLTIIKIHQILIHQFRSTAKRISHVQSGKIRGFCSNSIGQNLLISVCRTGNFI